MKTNLHSKQYRPNQTIEDHPIHPHSSSSKRTAVMDTLWSFVTHLGPGKRGILFLLVLILAAILAITPLFPHRVTPASASLDVFSGERAITHLPVIARERHPSGSPAQRRVRDYLLGQLTALGLEIEVQVINRVENVLARLTGTEPSGAILLQAHYDSYGGPGAADNGSGVSALLEIMRALAAGPQLRNDVIALFDDGEEFPDPFTGTKAFIREHPWMDDVRVAIGMDTAVRGFISTNDTGSDNGWIVQVLARAYTGGEWSSLSGGGNYDTQPFRYAGVRVLELEDNYPFVEQHTSQDVANIVNPGSVQQLGEQVLAVTRELGDLNLRDTSGEQETYLSLPFGGFVHYPEAWALPLAILAGILLVIAYGMVLRQKLATWRGLVVAILATVITAGLSACGANALWRAAPDLLGWETYLWSEWPEVIPPNGWLILILSNIMVLVLAAIAYKLTRRWSERASFALFGMSIFLIFAVFLAIFIPRAAILPTWPVLIGSAFWIGAALAKRNGKGWLVDAGVLLGSVPFVLFVMPLVPVVFMSDGTKSVAITTAVWVSCWGSFCPL